MTVAVLLVSHGTVENLDDLASFAASIRHGRPAPESLVAELRRRYEAIGGSPLNAINAQVARKLGERLGIRVVSANRLWAPYARDAIAALAARGVRRIALVPLAQHSARVYEADAQPAADACGVELRCAANWGHNDALCEAFASRIAPALAEAPSPDRTCVMMTAHSLPSSVVRSGDPYERDVRAAADAICAAVLRRASRPARFVLAFQSQGSQEPGNREPAAEWLGPDIRATLDRVAGEGDRHVIASPIGFLADHVETLYDLDVEARAAAQERGMTFSRAASLNADDDFIGVLEEVVRPLVASS